MNPFEAPLAPKKPDIKKDESGYVVGARKNSDGSVDYSRALHFTDPSDIKKLDDAFVASDQIKSDQRKKRLATPEGVKPGTTVMVSIDLDHAIFLNEEAIKKAREQGKPVDERTEKRLENLRLQYELLKKRQRIPGNQLSEDHSASYMADDIEDAIGTYEDMKDKGIKEEIFEFSPNHKRPISIDDVLKAAGDLKMRLIEETLRGNNTDLHT